MAPPVPRQAERCGESEGSMLPGPGPGSPAAAAASAPAPRGRRRRRESSGARATPQRRTPRSAPPPLGGALAPPRGAGGRRGAPGPRSGWDETAGAPSTPSAARPPPRGSLRSAPLRSPSPGRAGQLSSERGRRCRRHRRSSPCAQRKGRREPAPEGAPRTGGASTGPRPSARSAPAAGTCPRPRPRPRAGRARSRPGRGGAGTCPPPAGLLRSPPRRRRRRRRPAEPGAGAAAGSPCSAGAGGEDSRCPPAGLALREASAVCGVKGFLTSGFLRRAAGAAAESQRR